MVDISLDLDPNHKTLPTYKDLLVVDDDLVLTSDSDPNGTNPVLQNILQRMRFFLAEWFLDNTQGLPYFQQILVKNPDQSKIDAIFTNLILGTPGVTQLTAYSFNVNKPNRILDVEFKCQTTSGIVSYSGTLSPITGGQT